MIINQADPNEQTFENMAKYIAKTTDDQFSPKQDLSMAMNQSPAFFDPNGGFRKTPERNRDEETNHGSGATAFAVQNKLRKIKNTSSLGFSGEKPEGQYVSVLNLTQKAPVGTIIRQEGKSFSPVGNRSGIIPGMIKR